ncbi:MAG: hypothetical protein NT049_19095 [Planctomycetota bacterium]|nr:hypothetical protein [Planctomycetota bacterium]
MSGNQARPLPAWARTLTFLTLAWGIASLPCCLPLSCVYNRVVLSYGYTEALRNAPRLYLILMICLIVGSFITAVSAIVGGILLWARRPIAQRLLAVFGWAAISVGIGSAGVLFLGLILSGEVAEGWILPLIGATVGLAWNGAIAVYVLLIMRRAEVREDFRQWAENRRSGIEATKAP